MEHTSKLTRRGQTTLPAKIREALHAKPGDTLEYEVTEKGVMVRVKKPAIEDTLGAFVGVFGKATAKTEEDAIERTREARGWDDEDAAVFKTWAEE